jgi:hypothetical protein
VTLTIEIPPEVQRELVREAEIRGVDVPALAARLLEEAISRPAATPVPEERSPLRIRAWIDSLAEFSDQISPVPGETFSRGMIYRDHD